MEPSVAKMQYFNAKKNNARLYLYMGARAKIIKMQPFNNFYIDEAHKALDMFCFVVFL